MTSPFTAAALACALALHSAAFARAPGEQSQPAARQAIAAISQEQVRKIIDTLAAFGTRHTLSDTTSDTRGIGAARRWIKSELESYNNPAQSGNQQPPATRGNLRVSFEEYDQPPTERMPDGGRIVNVVAVLPGTMPEAAGRLYYVVGHYDSRNSETLNITDDAPGANDDASGTAVVMEIARVLAHRPLESTVVFLATAGEEQSLLGARYHASQAAERGDNIMGVLSNDIVGDPLGPNSRGETTRHLVRVFSEGLQTAGSALERESLLRAGAHSDSPSRQLARYIRDVARIEGTSVQPMLVFRMDRFLRGGDHTAFNENGFAAVRFTEVHEDYDRQHQTPRIENGKQFGDLPEFVDAAYAADVARLNAAALVHMANAPSPPAHARIITAQLEYTTTLRWEPSPEPDTAGYEIVWRDTTAPFWEHVQDVGNVTEFTIDLSKDNFFFGVRSYDTDGYRSPVVFPIAAKE